MQAGLGEGIRMREPRSLGEFIVLIPIVKSHHGYYNDIIVISMMMENNGY